MGNIKKSDLKYLMLNILILHCIVLRLNKIL